MPQPSAFDPLPGVVKGDGQTYQTGVGNQMVPAAAPPAGTPVQAPPGAIQALIAALAQAFAPKSITQAPQREKAAEDEALGKQF